MICKSSRPPTGCAHAAKLLEYWENRQILENLEPSNTFKAKAIFETQKKIIFFRHFTIFVCVIFWSKFVTLADGRLFPNPSLVLSRRKQKQGLQSIVSELAITEVLLRPKSLSHKFLSTAPHSWTRVSINLGQTQENLKTEYGFLNSEC